PRPGLIAAARRAVVGCAVRGGGVVTREGIALGVVRATGARAELRWAEAAHGTLITGAAAQDVTLAGLQMVHAALRLRKPVIVLDPGDPAIARALDTACAATGVPLLAARASSGDGRADSAPGGLAVDARVRGGATAVGADTRRAAVGAGAGNAGAAGASGLWGRAVTAERAPGGHVFGNPGGAAAEPEFGDRVADGLDRAVTAEREHRSQGAGDPGRAAAPPEFGDQVAEG